MSPALQTVLEPEARRMLARHGHVSPAKPPASLPTRRSATCASASRARASPTRHPASRGPTAPTSAYLQGLVEHWRSALRLARAGGAAQRLSAVQGAAARHRPAFPARRGPGPGPCPLLLSHGWPGSVFEFLEHHSAPHRSRPASAATRPMRSPWSRRRCPATACRSRPGSRASASRQIADCFAELMTDVLGYARFAAQGGDWGAFVTSRLGAVHADKLIGIHLNLLAVRRDPRMVAEPDAGGAAVPRRARALAEGGDGLPVDPGHAAADARLRPHRLAGGPGGVDRREVPRLVRLRRRRRERASRSDHLLAEHQPVLVHRRDRLVVLAVLRAHARAVADPRGRRRRADGLRRVPARDRCARRARWPSALYTDIRRWTRDAARRPLRGDGAARGAGAGDRRVLPAAQAGPELKRPSLADQRSGSPAPTGPERCVSGAGRSPGAPPFSSQRSCRRARRGGVDRGPRRVDGLGAFRQALHRFARRRSRAARHSPSAAK